MFAQEFQILEADNSPTLFHYRKAILQIPNRLGSQGFHHSSSPAASNPRRIKSRPAVGGADASTKGFSKDMPQKENR